MSSSSTTSTAIGSRSSAAWPSGSSTAQGWPGRLISTTDRDAAIDGAVFVLVQLRVGGQAARFTDETLPRRFGCIGQETTGAGGFAKALRTVPVVLELADDVARRSARTPGSSTSRTRSGSSPRPCSTPGTGPSACATWRSGSSAGWPSGSASRRIGSSSSTSAFGEVLVLGQRRVHVGRHEAADQVAQDPPVPQGQLPEDGAAAGHQGPRDVEVDDGGLLVAGLLPARREGQPRCQRLEQRPLQRREEAAQDPVHQLSRDRWNAGRALMRST